jgi:uncharacterized protein YdeI (YjbR/CyaY-like superfamily)
MSLIDAIPFAHIDDWRAWLEEEHARRDECWIAHPRADSELPGIARPLAIEEALCFGWIDSQARSVDADWYLQRFTPRRKNSVWSQRMRALALELIASGRMRPAGLAAVEEAKANGRWDTAYAGPATIAVPDDLRAALEASPSAAHSFATLDSANRYAILHRLATALRPQTRAERLSRFVSMLERGDTLHPRPSKTRTP